VCVTVSLLSIAFVDRPGASLEGLFVEEVGFLEGTRVLGFAPTGVFVFRLRLFVPVLATTRAFVGVAVLPTTSSWTLFVVILSSLADGVFDWFGTLAVLEAAVDILGSNTQEKKGVVCDGFFLRLQERKQ
jgi:hypothetical protein